MRVLDIGCGMGDVSLLAARLVGPSGHVTGIDRDLVVIEKARERGLDEVRGADIEFVYTELLNFHADRRFDAVVGRYVLMFQPDPVDAIVHAAKQVRPGGIVVFHESDLATRIQGYPNGTLFYRMCDLIAETERCRRGLGEPGLAPDTLIHGGGTSMAHDQSRGPGRRRIRFLYLSMAYGHS